MMDSYHSKVLIPFVDRLIRNKCHQDENGYQLTLNELDDHEKEQFAAHLLENDDRDIFSIYENEKYDDIVSSLIVMLKKDNLDNRLDFAESIRDNVTKYYEDRMSDLIKERLSIVEADDYHFIGYIKRERDNGEHYWARQ